MADSYPIHFEVTNTGKRERVRNGVRIPGAPATGKKSKPVVVTVTNRAEHLRLNACKSLELKKTTAKAAKTSATSDPGDDE